MTLTQLAGMAPAWPLPFRHALERIRTADVTGPLAGLLHALATAAAAALVTALSHWLFEDRLEWLTFLSGVLIASVVGLASRVSHAGVLIAGHAQKIQGLQDEITRRAADCKSAQRLAQIATQRLGQIATHLEVPVLYLDERRSCQYVNPAMKLLLESATGERVAGRGRDALLASLIGAEALQAVLGEVMSGFKQVIELAGGSPGRSRRMVLQPDFDAEGKVSGIFGFVEGAGEETADQAVATPPVPALVKETAEEAAGRAQATRYLMSALERGMLSLVALPVVPMEPQTARAGMVQTLMRMREEEDAGLPPGEFVTILSEQGLMPILDRWVVLDVLKHCQEQMRRCPADALPPVRIRTDAATLEDASFVALVARELKARRLPGSVLCFEIGADQLLGSGTEAASRIARLRAIGARVIVNDFGGRSDDLRILADASPDFVELPGDLVRQLARQPAARTRVRAIVDAARLYGVPTIAPMVEDSATVEALEIAGVDYVHGFVLTEPASLQTVLAESVRHWSRSAITPEELLPTMTA